MTVRRDMETIIETAKGNEEHEKILIRMHLGKFDSDANVKIVMSVLNRMKEGKI